MNDVGIGMTKEEKSVEDTTATVEANSRNSVFVVRCVNCWVGTVDAWRGSPTIFEG